MITPTVGRVVWFHPQSNSANSHFESTAVCAAIISKVLPDGSLNLGVFDGNGATHAMQNVPLIQDDDLAPEDGFYAEWMPYQKQVAAGEIEPLKHETAGGTLTLANAERSPYSHAAQSVKHQASKGTPRRHVP